jgi:beta-glucanase (GH16 family)
MGMETCVIARDLKAVRLRWIKYLHLFVVLAFVLISWTAVAKAGRHHGGKRTTQRRHKHRHHHRRRPKARHRRKHKRKPVSTAPTPGSPTPTANPASRSQPLGVPGNWKLAFDDEFHTMNLSDWQPNWLGANNTVSTKPVNSEEVECIDPAQSAVGGGVLTITATQRSCNGYNYASGLLESNGRFNFTYGYMEARMYLPSDGAGGIADWPAFWADGASWPADGEIDVMEGLDGPACWHFHYGTSSSPQQVGNCATGDFSGWHTYGADWEPGSITWYYDGKRVAQTTSGVTSQPMYLIVNLALKAQPIAPTTMHVDYVRVWQH